MITSILQIQTQRIKYAREGIMVLIIKTRNEIVFNVKYDTKSKRSKFMEVLCTYGWEHNIDDIIAWKYGWRYNII